jgi:hypothetical protein
MGSARWDADAVFGYDALQWKDPGETGCLRHPADLQITVQGAVVTLPIGNGKARASSALIFFLCLAAPVCVRADIYKCTKAGAVSYQETPCEGANVQEAHLQDRDSDRFVGCFVSTNSRSSHYYEIRANGAGTFQLIDENNPLASGVVLKRATNEELQAVSNGLHIKISNGLSRYFQQAERTYVSVSRTGNRYMSSSVPVSQPITAASLYGIYKGSDADNRPVFLLHTGGGVPQPVEKSACPAY